MDGTSVALTIISVLGTISSIIFAFLAFRRNDKKDTRDSGKSEGVLLSEIGYIKSSIDRIEKNLDRLEERYSNLSNKIVKVEESVAQAHKRITEHINDTLKHGGHLHEWYFIKHFICGSNGSYFTTYFFCRNKAYILA